MSLKYIRDAYGVPAKRGARIKFSGDPFKPDRRGIIVGASQQYVRVRMDDEKRIWTLHPTWKIEYIGVAEAEAIRNYRCIRT